MTLPVHARVDPDERTAVIETSFAAPAEVVWTLFSDPTKLARWWGPPGAPMTIERHELQPGGTVELTVSTDDGDIRARWTIHEVTAPHALAFTFSSDGIGPTEIAVSIDATAPTASTMTITVRFTSDATMRHGLDIGFVDGVARSCASAHRVVAG